MQRGEGIIGDLGPCVGGGGEKGGLARVGQTQQADIRDQFQAQPDCAFNAVLPRIGTARGLIGGTFEMQVAKAAIAALGNAEALTKRVHVRNQGFLILLQHSVPAGTRKMMSSPSLPVRCLPMPG